jgi:hypothetical protein
MGDTINKDFKKALSNADYVVEIRENDGYTVNEVLSNAYNTVSDELIIINVYGSVPIGKNAYYVEINFVINGQNDYQSMIKSENSLINDIYGSIDLYLINCYMIVTKMNFEVKNVVTFPLLCLEGSSLYLDMDSVKFYTKGYILCIAGIIFFLTMF